MEQASLKQPVITNPLEIQPDRSNEYNDKDFQTVNIDIPPGTDFNYTGAIKHSEILTKLKQEIKPIDLRQLIGLKEDEKPTRAQMRIKVIEEIQEIARENNWDLCRNHDFIYLFNNAYWDLVNKEELQAFLGEAAESMGVQWDHAKDYKFREELFKQFMAVSNLPTPVPLPNETKINFLNGTFLITPEKQVIRAFNPKDFITYQLPFEYEPNAKAPLFQSYLNKVQPDLNNQKVLAEFLGYVFINTDVLKLEKCLMLYGTGANGKSVFFEIVNALLGKENVSSYSLENLTDNTGYYRAKIGNKLVNYASELNGRMEIDKFKALSSGEPISARLPYGQPFTLLNYAKLIFNCNELPKDVEYTNAYFRRFLIVPFNVNIPEEEQDKELARKIIANELPGVFNWVMEGLKRLLVQKRFTDSPLVTKEIEDYKRQSDSVQLFLEEEGYQKITEFTHALQEMFVSYRNFCKDNGNISCSKRRFSDRLKNAGYLTTRKNSGYFINAEKTF